MKKSFNKLIVCDRCQVQKRLRTNGYLQHITVHAELQPHLASQIPVTEHILTCIFSSSHPAPYPKLLQLMSFPSLSFSILYNPAISATCSLFFLGSWLSSWQPWSLLSWTSSLALPYYHMTQFSLLVLSSLILPLPGLDLCRFL